MGSKRAAAKGPVGARRPVGRLTKRERRAVEDFVTAAKPRLRLADWTVRFDFKSLPQDSTATMAHLPKSRWATLTLGESFRRESAQVQRQTLVHELVHCHLFDLHETAERLVEDLTLGDAQAARTLLIDRCEWAVDTLADAFVPLVADLPVPADLT